MREKNLCHLKVRRKCPGDLEVASILSLRLNVNNVLFGGKSEQRREILISSTCTIANEIWLAAEVKTQWKNRRIYVEEMHYVK